MTIRARIRIWVDGWLLAGGLMRRAEHDEAEQRARKEAVNEVTADRDRAVSEGAEFAAGLRVVLRHLEEADRAARRHLGLKADGWLLAGGLMRRAEHDEFAGLSVPMWVVNAEQRARQEAVDEVTADRDRCVSEGAEFAAGLRVVLRHLEEADRAARRHLGLKAGGPSVEAHNETVVRLCSRIEARDKKLRVIGARVGNLAADLREPGGGPVAQKGALLAGAIAAGCEVHD